MVLNNLLEVLAICLLRWLKMFFFFRKLLCFFLNKFSIGTIHLLKIYWTSRALENIIVQYLQRDLKNSLTFFIIPKLSTRGNFLWQNMFYFITIILKDIRNQRKIKVQW